MSDFGEFQKPCSHKSNGRNLPGCFCPLPDLPAQHHLFLHDGKEFLRGLSPATPDPGCSMEIANVKCLAGVLLLPHAGCYERDDSVVALVAPAGKSLVPGLISKDAPLHPVQEARCQAFPSGYTAVLSRQCPVPDEKTIGSTVPWSASSPLWRRRSRAFPRSFSKSRAYRLRSAPMSGWQGGLSCTRRWRIFFSSERTGSLWSSRFWLGERLPRLLRKKMITEDTARGMCEHRLVEYRSLEVRLPDPCGTYGFGKDR